MSDRRKLGELQDKILGILSRYGPMNARQIYNATGIKIDIIYVRLRQMEIEKKVERCDPRTTVRGRVVSSWRTITEEIKQDDTNSTPRS